MVGRMIALLALSAWMACASAEENLALGKGYTWSLEPDYSLTADPDDARQLTDGKFAPKDGMLWAHRECVGWSYRTKQDRAVTVTVDLGSVQPISGFAWHYAAGCSGVIHPSSIAVYASDDAKIWRYAGDLMVNSVGENGAPRDDGSHERYVARSGRMPTKGRYVAFVVVTKPFVFCDELEVFRGDESLLGTVGDAHPVADPSAHALTCAVRNRVMADLERCAPEDEALREKVEALAFLPDAVGVETVLPLNDVHREVWRRNAVRLRAAGFDKPVFWTNCRWDNLDPLTVPSADALKDEPLVVEMMRNETRATAVNLLNPTDRELAVTVRVRGMPTTAGTDCREVLFTDTKLLEPVATALKAGSGDLIDLRIPSGSSKQVWISFARPHGAAGTHVGKVVAEGDGVRLEREIRLVLHDLDFPDAPRCHVGGWDYAMTNGSYYGSPGNDRDNLRLLKDMYVDTYMAQGRIMPTGAKFDAEGRLVNPDEVDYSYFDAWTARIPSARYYYVHVNVVRWRLSDPERSFMFEGEKVGTPRFRRMVAEYFKAWRDHMRTRGVDPRKVLLHLIDEPSDWRTAIIKAPLPPLIAAWSRVIKAAVPEFVIWENPDYENDASVGGDDLYGTSDVICPQLRWVADPGHANNLKFFRDLADRGKELWFYSVCMPSRLSDPEAYFRQKFWLAYQWGAKGTCFWAFGCGGGIGDSWHAYLQTKAEYSPYFVSPTSVMPSKHSEAIREGVEDYEYLAMLADAIAAARTRGEDVSAAERTLEAVSAAVLHQTGSGSRAKFARGDDTRWRAPKDRTSADRGAREVLRALEVLLKPHREIAILPGENWWGLCNGFGRQMPFTAETTLEIDLRKDNYAHQAESVLVSDRGRAIWCAEPVGVVFSNGVIRVSCDRGAIEVVEKAGTNLAEAFRFASSRWFPPAGEIPELLYFSAPQYNTWIELTYHQNERDILAYAQSMLDHGLPPGVFMIDDTWQRGYGCWQFEPTRFDDPKGMVEKLHTMGYKVLLWVAPFVSLDTPEFRRVQWGVNPDDVKGYPTRGGFISAPCEERQWESPAAVPVKWWNGVSALLDFTHPNAVAWFTEQLDRLQRDYGVDGFKFDGGSVSFYTGSRSYGGVAAAYNPEVPPAAQSGLYGKFALKYRGSEYRCTFGYGGKPVIMRLHDKNHTWDDLQRIVPDLIAAGFVGSPFICPDMVGGGNWTTFLPGAEFSQELFIRSAQIHALCPMMQISASPWRYLDAEHQSIFRTMVALRQRFAPRFVELAKAAALTGEPIMRNLEYNYPRMGYAAIRDEFMMGTDLLVAPQMVQGAENRDVVIPPGRWRADNGQIVEGPKRIVVSTPLSRLPHFVRMN